MRPAAVNERNQPPDQSWRRNRLFIAPGQEPSTPRGNTCKCACLLLKVCVVRLVKLLLDLESARCDFILEFRKLGDQLENSSPAVLRGRVGARESTRQQRRHTSCKFARMWLVSVALVALAARECSGLQFSGHIASRSPAFAPHLALSPAVRRTLSSHPPTTTLSVSKR